VRCFKGHEAPLLMAVVFDELEFRFLFHDSVF
jgi:hypothetical protein